VLTDDIVDAAAAGEVMARRRVEDERFAYFAEASIVFLDLPDAVFRGYEGDDELLSMPRADDPPPSELLRREVARLEPQRLYLPLGVGGHVDHQLMREFGFDLLDERPDWSMPAPDWAGRVVFYEDFPYAWWSDFRHLADMPPESLAGLPEGISLAPEYSEIADQIERKITGISLYESQMANLFGDTKAMATAVRRYGQAIAELGGARDSAERYWVSQRL
jgi:LmbE family N-acetylglucosaminyl deacetylase